MITGAYLSCNIGNAPIEGVMGWKASESADHLDGQTGANRGFTADKPGSKTLKVELQIIQDITSTPYTPVSAGTTISNLKLYRNQDDASPAFVVPTFNVFDSDNGAQAKTTFTINASGQNDGNFTKNDPS